MHIIKNGTIYNVEYKGNTAYNLQLNTQVPPTPTTEYLYFEDTSGNGNTLQIKKSNASAPTIEVFSSTDQTNWTSMGSTGTTAITASIPANGKLYLKATADRWGTVNSDTIYNSITVSNNNNRTNVGGSIMSLLYGDNYEGQTLTSSNTYAFVKLFDYNASIVSAENLKLPSNVVDYCYAGLFMHGNISTAPVLPATTMAPYCYEFMFLKNPSLNTPPQLPAMTLATGCYHKMFHEVNLTTAPALPATTLAPYCYELMFFGSGYGSAKFTTAPVLAATTLETGCYREMFKNAANLNSVTTYATDISASNCLSNWLNGVPATGDFYNYGGATYPSGASGIPSGWTEHTA